MDHSGSPRSSISSNRHPFPQVDSTQRPGSSGRDKPRRGSAASSITPFENLDPSAQSANHLTAEADNNGDKFIKELSMQVG